MKSQNQWLFELPVTLEANNQEWLWEQDFAEAPSSAGKKDTGTFAKVAEKIAPYVLPAVMAVSGVQAAQQKPKRQDDVVTPPQPPKDPNAAKALRAAAEMERKRREAERKRREEEEKKKQEKTGGNPPSSVKIQVPTFTGYPSPSVIPKTPAKNNAGFLTREADANLLKETLSRQSQWLFEVLPESISSEADYMAGKRRKGKEHTKTSGGSKTRTENQHQEGQTRQGSQNQRADQRNEATRQEIKRKRSERANALTGKANPSRAEVEKIWKAKKTEQEDVRAELDLARQRRQPELVKTLKEKFDLLENQIKDLGQLRLEV